MARKGFDWEAIKDDLETMRADKKSLKDLQRFLKEVHGFDCTVARISQVLKRGASAVN